MAVQDYFTLGFTILFSTPIVSTNCESSNNIFHSENVWWPTKFTFNGILFTRLFLKLNEATTIWLRPFLQSESCTGSQPSPALTSSSSPSWLDAPNCENIGVIVFRFQHGGGSTVLLLFHLPAVSGLFRHIWQHWPIACASSWNVFDHRHLYLYLYL